MPDPKPYPTPRTQLLQLAAAALILVGLPVIVRGADGGLDAEAARRFLTEGPGLLMPRAERERLAAGDPAAMSAAVGAFLAQDPDRATPGNELSEAIARRQALVGAAGLSPYDARAQLLFLHGAPTERVEVECAETYVPLEIWRYGIDPAGPALLLYQPAVGRHYQAWYPTSSKRALYTEEMEYLLEQIEELRGRIRGKRIDLAICKDAKRVDEISGVSGLFGFRHDRMRDADVDRWFAPPGDLGLWAKAALAVPETPEAAALPAPELTLSFPDWHDQRLVARFRVRFPAGTPLEPVEAAGGKEVRISVSGLIDREAGVFERFRNRFVFAPPAETTPPVLIVERALRPNESFVARLDVRDETTGRTVRVERAFTVPAEPTPEAAETTADAVVGQDLALTRSERRDSLVLLPPVGDVQFGLYRAEAIVIGDRIRRVRFSLDGRPQITRGTSPWTAELRLPNIPRETLLRAEGLDADGEVVAVDELLLNEPQGEPRVRLLEPPRGAHVSGAARATAAVVVPEGRRIEHVEFRLSDRSIATLTSPPWEVRFEVPTGEELTYLTVTAVYDDGTRVEDFRVLNATDFLAEVEVELVEVYATVTDANGTLVSELGREAFTLLDNGRPQTITRFERVTGLPLTLGLVLDTSGSMRESLGEAKLAASEFLSSVMAPKDRCFAVGFSGRPALLMPLTSDATAIEVAFRDLPAIGATALHDALVYSLYQYRGVRGRKAMVLLSDGDDLGSLVPWKETLEYARRAGVSIYTIGLGIGPGSIAIREKLRDLAAETGGHTWFIDKASDLAGAYEQIERELRSQYLLAFSPDPPAREGERHELQVRVDRRGYKVRAASGYTP